MATLNSIALELAHISNREHDLAYQERLKLEIKDAISIIIKQDISKSGVDARMNQYYIAELDIVDESEGLYKTQNKIFMPNRGVKGTPFTFLGSPDYKIIYYYGNLTQRYFRGRLKYGNNTLPICEYRDGYLYIWFPTDDFELDQIAISTIFDDFTDVVNYDANILSSLNITDDIELPIPHDVIQLVKERLLSTDLRANDIRTNIEDKELDN